MADLDSLKQKYQPVIDTIEGFQEFGAKIDDISLDGEKLVLKGEVPSKVIANRVWDAIKECDPEFSDLEHQIATTGGDDQPYTIQSGDNLSHVSKRFYGSANHYNTIAEHNGIDNPDHIRVGQEINVPPLG